MTSHAEPKCNSMYVIICPMKAVYDVAIFMRLTFDLRSTVLRSPLVHAWYTIGQLPT